MFTKELVHYSGIMNSGYKELISIPQSLPRN